MSTMLKRKIEEQNRLWERMQEIQRAAEEENRDWTAEERANWDAANTKIDEVSADIERLEGAAKRAAVDSEPVEDRGGDTGGNVEDVDKRYAAAFYRFMRSGTDGLTGEQRQLMAERRQEGRANFLGEASPAYGGYLVPDEYLATMQEAMKAYGGLINYANVITTSTGNNLQWPTNDDTGNKGAILAENTQIPDTDLTFGTRAIGAHTYTSKLVRVSLQLLQDSAFNLETWLPRKLGERIGRAVAEDLIAGTGVAEPTGLLPNATASGVTSTAANWNTFAAADQAAIYDSLIDLEHSIDPAYRMNLRFLFNDKVLAKLRKVKDADNRPLWLPVPVAGMPATINGQPYAIDQGMPWKASWASADRPILFGNFHEGYLVRQVLDVQQVRLAERYADYLQVGFFGFMRLDAMPDDANAVKALVLS